MFLGTNLIDAISNSALDAVENLVFPFERDKDTLLFYFEGEIGSVAIVIAIDLTQRIEQEAKNTGLLQWSCYTRAQAHA